MGFACVAQIQMECPRKSLTSMDPFLPQGLRSSGMLPRSACSTGSNDFLGSFHEHAAQVLRTILGLVLGVDSFLARVFLTLRFLKKVARVFFQRRSVLPRAKQRAMGSGFGSTARGHLTISGADGATTSLGETAGLVAELEMGEEALESVMM